MPTVAGCLLEKSCVSMLAVKNKDYTKSKFSKFEYSKFDRIKICNAEHRKYAQLKMSHASYSCRITVASS